MTSWIPGGRSRLVAGQAPAIPSYQPAGSPSGGPWQLAFWDDFETSYTTAYGTGPNPAVWSDHFINGDGVRVNNSTETQWYAHGYYGHSVAGSALTLTCAYQGSTAAVTAIDPLYNTTATGGQTCVFTSGMIQSHPGFQFTYGYAEARLKFPSAANAIWPAFWMMTADNVWPPEFDVQEYGGQGQGERSTFWDASQVTHSLGSPPGTPDYTQYHVYGLRWSAADITAFFDGTQTGTYTTAASIPSLPFHLIVNLATEAAAGTGYPAAMTIDYIRAWTAAGVPARPVITSVSPADGIPTAGTLTVNFAAVTGATSYRATSCPVDALADTGSEDTTARHAATGSSSPLVISGLANGVRYTATLAAVNGTGYSIESLPVPAL